MQGIYTATAHAKDASVEILSKPLAPPSPSINPSTSLSPLPHTIEKDPPLIRKQLDINHRELEELKHVVFLLDDKLEMVKSQGPVEEPPCLKQEYIPCTSPLMQHLQLLEKIVRELTTQLQLLISKIEL